MRKDGLVLTARPHLQTAAHALLALVCGFVGGAIFDMLHVPLPWMLGSLTAAAIIALAGPGWSLPRSLRNFARPTIGVMAGSAFTLPVVQSMLHWWPIIPLLMAFLATLTLVGRFFFIRICRFDGTTATFAAAPGGLSELTLLGGELGANLRTLVLVHSSRVVATVFAAPFIVQLLMPPAEGVVGLPPVNGGGPLSASDWLLLIGCAAAGYWVGRSFRQWGGILLVPLLLSAVVHATGLTEVGPPGWLIILVQVVVGSLVGARFAGIGWAEFRSTAFIGLAWTLIVLCLAFLFSLLAGSLIDLPLAALVLAFSPGGFAEMTIVAYAIGIEVAFVVSCHVIRITCILVFAPLIARFGMSDRGGE